MHREPQPVKLYTVGPMYRYAAPQRGRYREHWQLSVEAIGSDHPSVDAEIIQLYDALLVAVGRHRVHARAELDRLPRMPARLPRTSERVARCERRPPGRADEREGVREPAARVRQLRREAARRCKRRSTRRPRSESRSARPAESTSPPCAATSTRAESPTRSSRRWCAASTTTRAPPGSSSVPTRVRRARSRAEGATTAWSRRSAGLRSRESGSARGSNGSCSRSSTQARRRLAPTTDIFFAADDGASRALIASWLGTLRARGIASDTDYARRSLKGQLTQAARVGAETVVQVRADGATLRRRGRADEDVALDDVLARLTS